ncbi:MAG: tape measure protein, partial [Rhodanobacter sp.]
MANDLEIRIGAELAEIKAALVGLRNDVSNTGRVVNNAGKSAGKGFDEVEKSISRARNALAGFITAAGAIQALRGITRAADEVARFEAQLQLATDTQEEFNAALKGVYAIAQATRAPIQDVANTYATLERSTETLRPSQERLLSVLETVNKAIALTPVTAETARASLVQFGQALAGNFQAGAQELNSLLEQTPGLAEAIADGLGVPTAALKKMGEEGELSTEKVFIGLERIKDQIDAAFTEIPLTIGGAM